MIEKKRPYMNIKSLKKLILIILMTEGYGIMSLELWYRNYFDRNKIMFSKKFLNYEEFCFFR